MQKKVNEHFSVSTGNITNFLFKGFSISICYQFLLHNSHLMTFCNINSTIIFIICQYDNFMHISAPMLPAPERIGTIPGMPI